MKKIIATLVLGIVMTMGSTAAMAEGIIITDRNGIIITDRTAVTAITYLITGIIITD